MKHPEGMTLISVEPRNYDEIVELSRESEKPYTIFDLEQIWAKAKANNSVAFIMFVAPDFWKEDAR